ncbi:MAG TPA: metal-sensing transcriptional repressor [Xanthomonadaceae bacterium]|nr:metal-sensing transcriptional repressor [Xanthomonadaceae bacterium]
MHTTSAKHDTHPEIVKRLRRAVGQLNSIIAMIEDERPCEDVAMQMQAVEKAVVQAKKTFIHDHIDHCLEEGVTASPKALKAFKTISKYL